MIRKFTSDSCTKTSKQSLTKQNYLIFKAFDGRDGGLNCLRHDAITFATMEKLRIKNLTLTFIFYIIGILSFQAQDYKRTSIWYFGQNAGLDFNTSPPTPLTDGQINTIEGCATICDTNGNLLLYTDGRTVWNRNHQVMENGTGLFGNASSTQAALIVPLPGNDSFYFIFTTDASAGPLGLRYSIANIYHNHNMGMITVKNYLLHTPVAEKLTGVKHSNKKYYWIIAHEINSNNFVAYLLTEFGIVSCPIISSAGLYYSDYNAIGSLKISVDGKKIASSTWVDGFVELFDFDNTLGKVTEDLRVPNIYFPYGIEFSLCGNKIFVSERNRDLLCFNLKSKDVDTILSTKLSLLDTGSTSVYYLQASITGDIYCAVNETSELGVISFSGQTINESRQTLSTGISKHGLPNFVTSFFYQPQADFSYDLDCRTNSSKFYAHDTIEATTYNWKITKSDTQTFTGNPLIFQFSDTGAYAIELLAINGSDTARQVKSLYIQQPYNLNLGKHKGLCPGESLVLDAGSGQHCYSWNTGSTSSEITIDTAGIYNVKVVSNGFCTFYDTVQVSLIQALDSSVSILRSGDTLFASGNFHKYRWYRNNLLIQDSAVYFLLLKDPGTYKVIGADSLDCFEVNSIDIMIDTLTHLYQVSATPFLIYPNPTTGLIYLQNMPEQTVSCSVYDITGRLLLEATQVEHSLNISALKQGIYILRISDTTNQSYVFKIIKE